MLQNHKRRDAAFLLHPICVLIKINLEIMGGLTCK